MLSSLILSIIYIISETVSFFFFNFVSSCFIFLLKHSAIFFI
ncbi:440R [Invertebrate iridescent virus Kaz2018]|uniref:440R n=2 Tax=Iridovirus TaxID=10487 RepID=Q91F85_IIV6|nr:440R [Invertebrate iridescent virus 6]AAK82300.1 440R [Invertebrate iridescent virus 6]QMS79329.1 hypothetical protein IIV6-T1_432 [Invertebrate iridescent virus 6]QNH08850.1 440R [Invertebrate iridescent virus Kaz2018]